MDLFDYPDCGGRMLVQSFMTGEQRVLLSFEISDIDRSIRKQKLRREHPDWSELQVKHELMRQTFVHEPVPEWLEKMMREREEEERASR